MSKSSSFVSGERKRKIRGLLIPLRVLRSTIWNVGTRAKEYWHRCARLRDFKRGKGRLWKSRAPCVRFDRVRGLSARRPSSRWWGTESRWRNNRSVRSKGSFVGPFTYRSARKFRQSPAGSTRLETPGRLEDLGGSSSGRTRGNAVVLEVPLARCSWLAPRPLYRLPFRQPIFKMARGGKSGRNPDGSSHIPAWESCFVARESRLSFPNEATNYDGLYRHARVWDITFVNAQQLFTLGLKKLDSFCG